MTTLLFESSMSQQQPVASNSLLYDSNVSTDKFNKQIDSVKALLPKQYRKHNLFSYNKRHASKFLESIKFLDLTNPIDYAKFCALCSWALERKTKKFCPAGRIIAINHNKLNQLRLRLSKTRKHLDSTLISSEHSNDLSGTIKAEVLKVIIDGSLDYANLVSAQSNNTLSKIIAISSINSHLSCSECK